MAQGEHNNDEVSNPQDPRPPPGSSEGTDNGAHQSTLGYTDVTASDADTRGEDSGLGESSDPSTVTSDLKYPITATDYFIGPGPTTVPTEEGGSLLAVTAAAAIAKRQTSFSGSPGLDQLSVVTVQSQIGALSHVPGENGLFLPDVRTGAHHPNESLPTTGLSDLQPSVPGVKNSSNQWVWVESFQSFQSEATDQCTAEDVSNGHEDDVLPNNFAHPVVTGRQLTQPEIHEEQVMSGTWRDHDYNEFATLSSRLKTFPANAILDGVTVDMQTFAKSGFFYTIKNGLASVRCFHCGCSPRQWEKGMDPKTEHIILSPRCRAVFP